jgi:ribonuclease BN (tRNA processing enzyme)
LSPSIAPQVPKHEGSRIQYQPNSFHKTNFIDSEHHVMDITSRRQEVCYTVDVLSDGSEFTGQGSLFLSVWKKPRDATPTNMSWLEEAMEISSPIGRYAISGIGDLSSRLAADQRFKLAPTRAVFAPTCDSLDGLSALLLVLSSSGAPSLHIVSTRAEIMEELATIVLGSRRNLRISNCQVPHGGGWWEVYADPHLTVHCSRRDPDNRDNVTFLYSVHSGSDNNSTLALLPPGCTSIRQAYDDLVGNALPILNNNNNNHPLRITALIALDPYDAGWDTVEIPNCLVMVTKPQVSSSDPAILERSHSVITFLSKELPEAFGQSLPHMQHHADANVGGRRSRIDLPTVPFQLYSGTSIVLADFPRELNRGKAVSAQSMGDAWASTITSLQSFQESTLDSQAANTDENEIDLDDPDDCDENENDNNKECSSMDASRSPMLVVLGTGCATPSAVRGASAYALTVPSTDDASEQDIFLLDCGEGVTTMLSRFGPKDWQRRIRGAWISHAHLDHYGGLANLVRTIDSSSHEASSSSDSTRNTKNAKRQKTIPRCCWVMAPPKVLRYLDLCLNCHHGRHKADGHEVFKALLHHDPTTPPGPWSHFQSIKVAHNCYPAYALLTGWPKRMMSPLNKININKQHQPMSWFCFSGDTRPSGSLVQQCRGVRRDGDAFFLVHEATFEDADQDQAELKKHSTVSEAISVAKDIGATRLLLTHFSQRYVSLQGLPVPFTDTNFRVGLAMDGLHVILE